MPKLDVNVKEIVCTGILRTQNLASINNVKKPSRKTSVTETVAKYANHLTRCHYPHNLTIFPGCHYTVNLTMSPCVIIQLT